MNSCDNFLNNLSGLLDGDISKPILQSINAHFISCVSCRETYERALHISRAVKKIPRVKASDSFEERLRLRLQDEMKASKETTINRITHSSGSIPIKPVFATLTAAAAIIAAFVLIDSQFLSDKSDKPMIVPHLEIPRPGSPQVQRSIMQPNSLQISSASDSSLYVNSYINYPRSNTEEILKNLGAHTQAVKDKKY